MKYDEELPECDCVDEPVVVADLVADGEGVELAVEEAEADPVTVEDALEDAVRDAEPVDEAVAEPVRLPEDDELPERLKLLVDEPGRGAAA
jgi:hypothetical protein